MVLKETKLKVDRTLKQISDTYSMMNQRQTKTLDLSLGADGVVMFSVRSVATPPLHSGKLPASSSSEA